MLGNSPMTERVTIDTNCIIDLEEQRKFAPHVTKLLEMDSAGIIKLMVPAICASERRPDGKRLGNISEFFDRLSQLGFKNSEILKPLAYFDVTFWDWAIYSGPDLEAQEKEIQEILFPAIPFNYQDFCAIEKIPPQKTPLARKWINTKCDVLVLWSHIYYGGSIFITSDNNFHKETKKQRLESLGAKKMVWAGSNIYSGPTRHCSGRGQRQATPLSYFVGSKRSTTWPRNPKPSRPHQTLPWGRAPAS